MMRALLPCGSARGVWRTGPMYTGPGAPRLTSLRRPRWRHLSLLVKSVWWILRAPFPASLPAGGTFGHLPDRPCGRCL
eukprot:16435908-Heterocapsa_arctica.AAC.1